LISEEVELGTQGNFDHGVCGGIRDFIPKSLSLLYKKKHGVE
jgi:hypothetical protein